MTVMDVLNYGYNTSTTQFYRRDPANVSSLAFNAVEAYPPLVVPAGQLGHVVDVADHSAVTLPLPCNSTVTPSFSAPKGVKAVVQAVYDVPKQYHIPTGSPVMATVDVNMADSTAISTTDWEFDVDLSEFLTALTIVSWKVWAPGYYTRRGAAILSGIMGALPRYRMKITASFTHMGQPDAGEDTISLSVSLHIRYTSFALGWFAPRPTSEEESIAEGFAVLPFSTPKIGEGSVCAAEDDEGPSSSSDTSLQWVRL